MDSGFQQPITIKKAIDNVFDRHYLLPAIQRKFVWSAYQIEMLFDSILRGYPINSFMFWEVKDPQIKRNFKFYQFIEEFREFFKVNNPDIDTTGVKDFKAVIDGQQRLTSLYLGLRGSYAYKMPRKWWVDTEENLPTRKLYLNLLNPVNQEHDNQKLYDFRFLSENDLSKEKNKTTDYYWFEVKNILELDTLKKVNNYLFKHNMFENDFAQDTLINFHQRVHSDKLINFYLEEEQEPDKVLEVFIRTNSGGTSLSFSDLLMSIASANWEKIDARKEIDDLINKVYLIGRPGFIINKDFVLKTCLVLFIENIKFQLKNFDHKNVQKFEENWQDVKKSILAGFTLLEKLGFNDKTLRAKNAAIPVIYYIYHKGISSTINNPAHHKDERKTIQQWLNLSLLKSIFSGQTDTVLATIRKCIKDNLAAADFPLGVIKSEFKSNPAKNYSMDDDFVEGLLETQYEDVDSFHVLSLLYPNLDYYNQDFHKDHLHPASFFRNIDNDGAKIKPEDIDFFKDPKNWNSLLNLQLLNGRLNESKQDMMLEDWIKANQIRVEELLIPSDANLEIEHFKSFVEKRKALLSEELKNLIR
jgi:uncharacterized protein with ParB-like and HNH nuclease domain